MKIELKPYTPKWNEEFQITSNELAQTLSPFKPQIEHFGSTAIPGLIAKPIIDILVRISQEAELDEVVRPMISSGHIYYQAFNKVMPDRRLFVKLERQSEVSLPEIFDDLENILHEEINHLRLAHIHIWDFKTNEWDRHLAFRDYLIANEQIAADYSQLKKELSLKSWSNGMQYNEAKSDFINQIETKALRWYKVNRQSKL